MNDIRLMPLSPATDQQLQSPLSKLPSELPVDQQLQSPLGKLPSDLIALIATKLPDNCSVFHLSSTCRKIDRALMCNQDLVRICSERLFERGKLKFEEVKKKIRVSDINHEWKACEKFYTAQSVPAEAPITQLKEFAGRVKTSEDIIAGENCYSWFYPVCATACFLTCGCGCLACVILAGMTIYNRCVHGVCVIAYDDDPNGERDYLNPNK